MDALAADRQSPSGQSPRDQLQDEHGTVSVGRRVNPSRAQRTGRSSHSTPRYHIAVDGEPYAEPAAVTPSSSAYTCTSDEDDGEHEEEEEDGEEEEAAVPVRAPLPAPSSSSLQIGAGMYDVTGPAAEVGMFGYAKAGQLTSGIHMRLRARAFAFYHAPSDTRCVYVCADLGMVSEWVTQTVLERLARHQDIPPGTYTRENVMLSATHTHCSPGGLSHYFIYSVHPPLRGADRQNFECVVDGIVHAIVRAHNNLQPAFIRTATGTCLGASVNRSLEAYLANPPSEREQFEHNTDKEMTLWRFDGVDGYPIGMINWFPVHPTSMGNWYTLITGDNKGYAAHAFEREHGTHHLLDRPRAFVAGFAQSNEGDVSPNICGPRCCETQQDEDYERMLIVAKAQLRTARKLYAQALEQSPPLSGSIRFAHQYVEYGRIQLEPQWQLHPDCSPFSTSSGCIGLSMMSGTLFDGRGIDAVPEGVQWGTYPRITTLPELQALQHEKPVIFPTARYGLSPVVLPVQLFSIGKLSIAAVPFEVTTMAGRRLRAAVRSSIVRLSGGADDIDLPVISGLSNAYCGYMTTREEYAVQRYEGASTHFGPNQLTATCQVFELLARQLTSKDCPIPEYAGRDPPRITGVGAFDFNISVLHDGLSRSGVTFGSVVAGYDSQERYVAGVDTVTVRFHAGHPKNGLRTQGTFLEVQRWQPDEDRSEGGVWVIHADDGDTDTCFHWHRLGAFASIATIEWRVPADAPPGVYRIKVNGDYKRLLRRGVTSYSGISSSFTVAVKK